MSGKGTPRPFDFRLPNVLSISSSGHKFGESICGTGWIVFRQRENLAEHIAVTVTYLGGSSDSLTLNFSRPASGPYVRKFELRMVLIIVSLFKPYTFHAKFQSSISYCDSARKVI